MAETTSEAEAAAAVAAAAAALNWSEKLASYKTPLGEVGLKRHPVPTLMRLPNWDALLGTLLLPLQPLAASEPPSPWPRLR